MYHAVKDKLGEEVEFVQHDTKNLDEYEAILIRRLFLTVTIYVQEPSLDKLNYERSSKSSKRRKTDPRYW